MKTCFCIAIMLQCFVLGLAMDTSSAATISARVTFSEYGADSTAVPISVELLQGVVVKQSESVFLDSNGRFAVLSITAGVYDVRIKASHWLSALRANVNVIGDIDIGTVTLTNGDCDGDDEVTSTDLSILGLALGSTPGDSNWDSTADLDGDGEITSTDLSILGLSLGIAGESVETTEYVYIPGEPSGNVVPVVNASEAYSTIGSTSSQGHPLEYSFNWGDGTSTPWSTSIVAFHSWNSVGMYTVTVSARCQVHPIIVATSGGLPVNVADITEMIYIPAGSFLMGNSNVENDAKYPYSNELPQHLVYLSDYYISKYEVTRGQYRQFMDSGGYANPSYWSMDGWSWKVDFCRTEPEWWGPDQDWAAYVNEGSQPFTQTDNHPVVGITYYEAEAFCNWAGGHLPTEAQWEKGARWTGTHPNIYPWGDGWDAEKCNNFHDHSPAGGGYQSYQTAPVGSYPDGASPYGCQDMAGNAWEWCKDWYGEAYYSQSPANDPQGPASPDHGSRVVRGDSWGGYYSYGGLEMRCAYRDNYFPNYYYYYGYHSGFRLAR